MWWRRCKTAHTLVTTFAINRFLTLATSCKMLEVLVNINVSISVIKWIKIKIILTLKKLNYLVLYYCGRESFKNQIFLFNFL